MQDKLQNMFDRQYELAKNFIPIAKLHEEQDFSVERQQYLATYCQLLTEEGVEFLRELPARKFWRPSINKNDVNRQALLEELADIWHIVIALSLISGITADEMHDLYVAKNEINLQRVTGKS